MGAPVAVIITIHIPKTSNRTDFIGEKTGERRLILYPIQNVTWFGIKSCLLRGRDSMDRRNGTHYYKMGILSQGRIPIVLFCFLALAAFVVLSSDAHAYERYNSGCQSCHGSFTGSTSPKGTTFPSGSKHEMHRASSAMGTACNLCHTSGDNRNPYMKSSDGVSGVPGLGCTGCHNGNGLRAHHAANGVGVCSNCHSAGTAPPENQLPPYYGTSATKANTP